MLLEKWYFFSLEKVYSLSFIARLDLYGLILLFAVGIIAYIFNHRKRTQLRIKKPNPTQAVLVLAIVLTLFYSLFLNINKKTLEWDAIALYDARAMMLKAGDKFSDMVKYSKYDQITYYYLMYPPYTSIAHYFMNATDVPVGVFYGTYLVVLAVVVYAFIRKYFGTTIALSALLIVILNKDIFMSSILEYTNLPYTVAITLGVCLLFDYLKEDKQWKLIYAVILIATTSWIRFLEPVWLVILICFAIALLIKKISIKNIFSVLLFAAICMVEYFAWTYFTKSIAVNPNSVGLNTSQLGGMILGIFTGNLFEVTKKFIKWMSVPIFMYSLIGVSGLMLIKILKKSPALLFLFLVVPASLTLYIFATYFSSFQGVWWLGLGGSIVRSSAFLLPVTLFNILFLSRKITNLNKVRKIIGHE
jgi:hypothetical protein